MLRSEPLGALHCSSTRQVASLCPAPFLSPRLVSSRLARGTRLVSSRPQLVVSHVALRVRAMLCQTTPSIKCELICEERRRCADRTRKLVTMQPKHQKRWATAPRRLARQRRPLSPHFESRGSCTSTSASLSPLPTLTSTPKCTTRSLRTASVCPDRVLSSLDLLAARQPLVSAHTFSQHYSRATLGSVTLHLATAGRSGAARFKSFRWRRTAEFGSGGRPAEPVDTRAHSRGAA